MDGGGRFLRSLKALAGLLVRRDRGAHSSTPGERIRARGSLPYPRHGTGSFLIIAACGASIAVGAANSGWLDSFREDHGPFRDIAARAFGFTIEAVALAGNRELSDAEVLAIAGIHPTDSLAFLDAGAARAKLRSHALISEASVRKLYPGRLEIEIIERQPQALWQVDGDVSLIAADGTVIDVLRDKRFLRLPHIVGPGANKRVREYIELLAKAPRLGAKVRAGILVSERRWTLKLHNGVEIKLPEDNMAEALIDLEKLDNAEHVLDRAIITADLRVAGRVALRLTEEAAAARHEMLEKKLPKVKGRA